MAQSRLIRPLSNHYHDFTEKILNETPEDTPFKFKNKMDSDNYIKKPKPTFILEPEIAPVENFIEPIRQPQIKSPTFCEKIFGKCMGNNSKHENEIVDQKNTGEIKIEKQKIKEPKLRNYPIKLKNEQSLHFSACQCEMCFSKNREMQVPPQGQVLPQGETVTYNESNSIQPQHYNEVESQYQNYEHNLNGENNGKNWSGEEN